MQPETLIWKFDRQGMERPLKEQLDRLKVDINLAFKKISWYNLNPIHRNAIARSKAVNARLKHLRELQKQADTIQKSIK